MLKKYNALDFYSSLDFPSIAFFRALILDSRDCDLENTV